MGEPSLLGGESGLPTRRAAVAAARGAIAIALEDDGVGLVVPLMETLPSGELPNALPSAAQAAKAGRDRGASVLERRNAEDKARQSGALRKQRRSSR